MNMRLLTLTLFLIGMTCVNCFLKTNTTSGQTTANTNGQQQASAGLGKSSPPEKKLLWDFRGIKGFPPRKKISKAEANAVLKYIFGDKLNGNIYPGGVMEPGYPPVMDRFSGSFTKPGASETLYYVTGCEDDGSFTLELDEGDHPGTSSNSCFPDDKSYVDWIAIYDGSTPVLKIKESLGTIVGTVTGVSGNGIDGILGVRQIGAMEIGRLGQISGNEFKVISNFNGYASACETRHEVVGSMLYYVPANDGKTAEFSESYYRASCVGVEKTGWRWNVAAEQEFDEFFKDNP